MSKLDPKNLPRPKSRQELPKHAQSVFKGEIFTVNQWPQKLFDNSVHTFEKLSRSDSVGILAVTKDRKILISHQEQPGMEPFISLLGGVIDPGETPLDAAVRELHEEAGAEAEVWEHWFSTQPITKIDWAIYMLIAKEVNLTADQHLDGGERIKIEAVTLDEFLAVMQKDEFRDFEVAIKIFRMLQNNQRAELEQLLFE